MILKNLIKFKSVYSLVFLFIGIGILSCEDDIREVTLFDKGTAEATASSTNIEFGETIDFASTSTKVQTLSWTFAGGSPATSTDANVTVTYASPGTFEAKLTVKYIDNTIDTKTFAITVNGPDTPLPYNGTAAAIPGTIEAENYNIGGQGVAYNDNEAGNLAEAAGSATYRDDDGVDVQVSADGSLINIGYTNAGEWAYYTVNVATAGSYDFDFKVASGSVDGGKSIKLQLLNQTTGALSELGETGDFANTGGWGTYVSSVISGVNLAAGLNTLRIFFTGGNTNLDKINVTATSTGGGGGVPLGPLNIAIATNNVANEAGYIAALEAAGHTVEAISQKYENLTDAGVTTLNGFDLVIISRNNNSGAYGTNADVRARWMSVTTPVIIISPYVARMSRLQLLNNDGGVDGVGTSLDAVIEDHPVFTGIDLTAGNTGAIFGTGFGAHVVDTSDAGNGTLIATAGTTNSVALAEWNANTEFYTGSSSAAGKRMFMAASSTYDFNDIGTKYFLNVVEYIVSGSVYAGPSGPIDGLGIYSEQTFTDSNPAVIPPANNGNFIITEVGNAAEGSKALYYKFDPANSTTSVTWGAMSIMSPTTPIDATPYTHYNISLKSTSPTNIRIRINAGGNFWVTLSTSGTDATYGFARDGQWHNVRIPLADFGAANLASISQILVLRSDDADFGTTSPADTTRDYDWYVDNIYLD